MEMAKLVSVWILWIAGLFGVVDMCMVYSAESDWDKIELVQ